MGNDRFIFAENLCAVMRRKKVNPATVADELGMTHSVFNRYMQGRSMPNATMMKRMSKVLGVTMEILMQGIGDE